jgi:hypothetical protein
MINNQQMELGFGSGRACPSMNRRPRGARRAGWWFDRMRQAVDRALDGQPAPPPRAEQIWFPE